MPRKKTRKRSQFGNEDEDEEDERLPSEICQDGKYDAPIPKKGRSSTVVSKTTEDSLEAKSSGVVDEKVDEIAGGSEGTKEVVSNKSVKESVNASNAGGQDSTNGVDSTEGKVETNTNEGKETSINTKTTNVVSPEQYKTKPIRKTVVVEGGRFRGNQMYTVNTRSNHVVVLTRGTRGVNTGGNGSAYLAPLRSEIWKNREFYKDKYSIDYLGSEVSQDNPFSKRTVLTSNSNYASDFVYFVAYVGKDGKNTVETRKAFANSIAALNNNATMQMTYTYPSERNKIFFKGDVTPQDETKLPPLSDFLMVFDVLNVMRDYYKDDETKMTNKDLVEDDETMSLFFAPDLHSVVREKVHDVDKPADDEHHFSHDIPQFTFS